MIKILPSFIEIKTKNYHSNTIHNFVTIFKEIIQLCALCNDQKFDKRHQIIELNMTLFDRLTFTTLQEPI